MAGPMARLWLGRASTSEREGRVEKSKMKTAGRDPSPAFLWGPRRATALCWVHQMGKM